MHPLAPAAEYNPGAQLAQLVAAALVAARPCAQFWHAEEAAAPNAAEKAPAAQGVQSARPGPPEYVPAAQLEHALDAIAE